MDIKAASSAPATGKRGRDDNAPRRGKKARAEKPEPATSRMDVAAVSSGPATGKRGRDDDAPGQGKRARAEKREPATSQSVMAGPASGLDPIPGGGATGTASDGAATHPPVSAPVRRLATQITGLGSGGETTALMISGRPESPFSDTMGDHSTAFIVQQQAIANAVLGQTPDAAAKRVQELLKASRDLPGYHLIPSLPADHAQRLKTWEEHTHDIAQTLVTGRSPEADRVLLVQELVSAFLRFRELIPLTTIRTRQIEPANAGKGHGEAKWASTLNEFAALKDRDRASEARKTEARDAVLHLLDTRGLALVALEPDPHTLAALAPGMGAAGDRKSRRDAIVVQHIRSIAMRHPGVIETLWGSASQAGDWLAAYADQRMEQRSQEDREFYGGRVKAVDEWMKWLLLGGHRHPETGLLDGADLDEWTALGNQRADHAARVVASGGTVPPAPAHTAKSDGRSLRPRLPQSAAPRGASTPPASRMSSSSSDSSSSSSGSAPSRSGKDSADEDAMDVAAVMTQPKTGETDQVGNLAAQLVLNGGVIEDLVVAGRPHRAFTGSMGAHTTAWVAHYDAVRNAVLGRTPDDALKDLRDLKKATGDDEKLLAKAGFKFDKHRGNLMAALEERLDKALSDTPKAPAVFKPLLLQKCVVLLLAYIESLPGATVNAANTDGHGEGRPRNALRNPGNVSEKELKDYVWSLLDISSPEITADQKVVLKKIHKRVIRRAYPEAAKKIGLS
ncbi:hypothetical protein ACGFZS_43415 [Streptomyces sp. NPDC048288]|uniref:hypothetical protein n=1 Tax=Streptomyces sp. NPDC048288 TaxID=3365529 RepID=UPI003719E4F9